ncbi:MAG: AmmeMemoRadiSam system radical SAM enzyme [Pseudomonadales bacterium]|nr:AmmeMemoRadiSam system radical SAM enzyme [Pseudomonadales bacterium]NRA18010.1 AmmeMemoRadiSam system radical SAM enzyme [Oceanospirillaceae bacterium]
MSDKSFPARYWHSLENGKVQCDLCPHRCKLKNGQRGLCFTRANQDNAMVLHSYGRSSGFCVDPIEKKPLNHFLPGTPVLSFGTAGCNLTCKFCQNWDMSKSREMDTLASSASAETLAAACLQTSCRSIAYTYNDPVIFLEYAVDVAQACAEVGVKSIAVSAGYISAEPRIEFFQNMHATNIDLKGFNDVFYKKICGGQLSAVKETLQYLVTDTDVWLEVTNLLIPQANDSPAELERMCQWFVETLGPDIPLHFSAFHPDFKMLDKPVTPLQTLLMAREIALQAGIKYVYAGNVHHTESGSSYCYHCKKLVIERNYYELGEWHLSAEGACDYCGHIMPGVFEAHPGTWGARRQPLNIIQSREL